MISRLMRMWYLLCTGICIFFSVVISNIFLRIKYKEKNCFYVLVTAGSGDILYTLGYLSAYKETHNISEKICVVLLRSRFELSQFYKHEGFTFVEISERMFGICKCATRAVRGDFTLIKCKNILFFFPWGYVKKRGLQSLSEVKFPHVIKYLGLKLPENACFSAPVVPTTDISSFVSDYHLKEGKTIILCPFANAIKELDINFYQQLACDLMQNGFSVVINIAKGDSYNIEGAHNIDCTLTEVMTLANYCGYVVGIRSGLFDLLPFSNARIVALYPKDCKTYSFFDINVVVEKEDKKQYMMQDDLMLDVAEVKKLLAL